MVTKLKQNKLFIISVVLLTVGAILFCVAFGKRQYYINSQSYLDVEEQDYINDIYTHYFLENYPQNKLTVDDITNDDIENYRTYFGSMGDQIDSIVNQYSDNINLAEESDNQEEVESLKKTRQEKITTVISNFSDSQTTKEKISEETNNYLKNLKKSELDNSLEFNNINNNYWYYFKDNSGVIYTNNDELKKLDSTQDIQAKMSSDSYESHVFLFDDLDVFINLNDEDYPWLPTISNNVKGYMYVKSGSQVESYLMSTDIGISDTTPAITFSIIIFMIGILVSVIYFRQTSSNINHIFSFNRIPIDIRLFALLLFSIAFLTLSFIVSQFSIYGFGIILVFLLFSFYFAFLLFFIKDMFLSIRHTEGIPSLKEQWQNSAYKVINKKFSTFIGHFSFLTQLFLSFIFVLVIYIFMSNYRYNSFIVLLCFVLFLCYVLWVIAKVKQLQGIIIRVDKLSNLNSEGQKITYNLDDISSSLYELEDYVRTSKSEHKQNEQLKAELLTNVSHDLRTPLTSIISYGDILTQKDLSEESKIEYITIINQKSMRMKRLIDDLFDVTKMDNGDIQLTKTTLDLTQLIVQATSEYQDSFDKNDLKLVFTFPEEPVMIQVDGDKIWRVIDNLVGNIVKYAMPNTRVFIKLMESEDFATIQLKNTSRYELNEDAELLTERFKRGDSSRHEEGSGLGLAIAQSIVNLHNGTLTIEVDGDLYKITVRLPKNENEDKLNIQN